MKSMMAMVAALLIFQNSAHAAEEKEVQIGINGVYVPAGLRADSDAFAVVNGIFQNGCYKWSHAEINADDEYNHTIKTFAKVSQGMCIMVLIPFQKEVRLGKLNPGKHTLKFLNGDGTYLEKVLVVE